MSIYLTKEKKIVVQGITGQIGLVQTKLALDYGTNIVAGVVPGKSGKSIFNLPIYNSVKEAVANKGCNASVLYVPVKSVLEAATEALEAGLGLLVIITEHVPVLDTMRIREISKKKGAIVIGPNCPGLLTPGVGKMGIIPDQAASKGSIGIISRSGTLAFEITANLTNAGIGQSEIVGIGGDPEPGTTMVEALAAFEDDPQTKGIVIIGEVGGSAEESASVFIKSHMKKPVFAFIAGVTAPPGKRMGHAGAIIQGNSGIPEHKITALQAAGVRVAKSPKRIPQMIKDSGIL